MQSVSLTAKSVPNNLEAEAALLGSILLDDAALNIALERIKANDFYSEAHRTIYTKMMELSEKSLPVELVTLAEELGKDGLLEKARGKAYLASLIDGVPIASNPSAAAYAQIIKEKSIIRSLINASQNIVAHCYEGVDDPEILLDSAQKQLFEIAETDVPSRFHHVKEFAADVMEKLSKHQGTVTGIATGFTELDDKTSGFQPGDLIIIAARPSLGKTALALNIAAHASVIQKKISAIFSLEMSKESLLARLLCSEGRIDSHKLRTGFASQDDWVKMSKALGRLVEAPLYIDDTATLSLMQIRAKARRLKAEKKSLDLIIIDYLQLITEHGRFENRNQEVSYISRGLKAVAKELNVPVIALSQLSRAPEAGKGREPQLSDLRDSGSIEQDADMVIFIRRGPMEAEPHEGVLTLLDIAKQRNGPTGPIKLVFQKLYTCFENHTARDDEIYEPRQLRSDSQHSLSS